MIKYGDIGISIPTGLMLLIFSAFVVSGCGHGPIKPAPKPTARPPLASLGYIIQAGAFANMENALRFTEKLRARGIDAYHYYDRSKLYKVRFGNFATRTAAVKRANYLLSKGLIDVFYIVAPAQHTTADIRDNLIKTADSFIGVPYRWGGESAAEGFDCSGFTMTVYKLNGLDLPRSSRAQWQKGTYVSRSRMQKGDLVFFRTTGSPKISHVGIYEGNGRFIHAPGRGDHVQRASLNSRYFSKHFTGAKTYF
jgi:hypothetical protein